MALYQTLLYSLASRILVQDTGRFDAYQINITKLSDKLIGSTARDIHFFRICINSIYKEGSIGIALSDEAPLLDELYNKIKESDIHLLDKIQKLQIRYLLKNIESARELYEAKPEVIPMIST